MIRLKIGITKAGTCNYFRVYEQEGLDYYRVNLLTGSYLGIEHRPEVCTCASEVAKVYLRGTDTESDLKSWAFSGRVSPDKVIAAIQNGLEKIKVVNLKCNVQQVDNVTIAEWIGEL